MSAFRRLHQGKSPLILANAWDAGSARLIESLGAPAIATTSAGIAWTLGYPDDNLLPPAKLADMVGAIARVISVPLSVDFEAGYSDDPAQVAENIKPLLDAGAVGINIEDGTNPASHLAAKIDRIKRTAAVMGVDLFVNARTDIYLKALRPDGERLNETIERGNLYQSAGAEGFFTPGVTDELTARAIAETVPLPLNLLARPGLPPAAELAHWGVRRLSAGSAVTQSAWGFVQGLVREFLAEGHSEIVTSGSLNYGQIQQLLEL